MLGVAGYLRKPFAMDVMLETVSKVLGFSPKTPATPLKKKPLSKRKTEE
jgi:DNA-binding NarL/FixJ family response regulator